jgi:hypothetical protein
MSGVEAAGFILAAFPLLISALEDYRQGWEILEDWWKIKREVRTWHSLISRTRNTVTIPRHGARTIA